MLKQAGKIALVILLLIIPSHFLLAQQEENITITTYYPSPYGSYNELRTNKMVIGETSSSVLAAPDFNGGLTFQGIDTDPSTYPLGTIYFNSADKVFRYSDGAGWKDLSGMGGKIEAYNSETSAWETLGTLKYVGFASVWDTDGNEYTFLNGKIYKNASLLSHNCVTGYREWSAQNVWGISPNITDAGLNNFCKYCNGNRTMISRAGSGQQTIWWGFTQLAALDIGSGCTVTNQESVNQTLFAITCCYVYTNLRWQ